MKQLNIYKIVNIIFYKFEIVCYCQELLICTTPL